MNVKEFFEMSIKEVLLMMVEKRENNLTAVLSGIDEHKVVIEISCNVIGGGSEDGDE